ncbi:reverse transcriptase domain-containing protein [Tanacetum coccineum]
MRGKEQIWQDMDMHASDAALREYCDRNYHQLLPIIAEKVHQEKHSESGTPSGKRDLKKRLGSRRIHSAWRQGKKCVHTLEQLKTSVKAKDLSQPWVCKETNPFTPRIPYFDLPKRTRMPSHVKTYDGSEDPEDHLKIFQAAAKVERWAMPTWCHMFNSTLTGSTRVWFDDLPSESIDSYDNLKEAFLANFRQQKKCIKDHVEIHHIKQREGESTEDFVRRFKVESRDVKGAPKIIRILGFMHGITNPELIKLLHDKIPKSVDEMMRITTSFLRGRWQLVTKNEGCHFRHGNSRRPDISRISRKEVLKISKGQSGDRIGSLFSQNLQKKF